MQGRFYNKYVLLRAIRVHIIDEKKYIDELVMKDK